MKLAVVVIGIAFFAAVNGKRFSVPDCILMDMSGTITMTAERNGTTETSVLTLDDSDPSVNASCGNGSNANTLTVTFNNSAVWTLLFTVDGSEMVRMDQTVAFDPSVIFNSNFTSEQVSVADVGNFSLSSVNASFLCNAEQTIDYSPSSEDNSTFTVSQVISSLQVQAFNLQNNTFSPAEDCATNSSTPSSVTTAPAPVTTATTAPTPTTPAIPSPGPAAVETFVVNNSQGVCFRLEAGLQFAVEYTTSSNTTVFSQVIPISSNASTVTGTCGNSSATMVITGTDFVLQITETDSNNRASSTITLNVTLDAENFPNATEANQTVQFEVTQQFSLSDPNTFYACSPQQEVTFPNTGTTLYANGVKLQAFSLDNGNFSGSGESCQVDTSSASPVTTPSPTPTPAPGDNTYIVNETGITCIVLKGDISFSNVTYTKNDNSTATVTLNIPAQNQTTFSGNCNMTGGMEQQLVIQWNSNWNLSLTFAKGSQQDSSMLGATSNEYTLQDIVFEYTLTSESFPDALNPGQRVVASQMNISSDFLKASVNGGSYKCDAKVTETLDNGVQFETTNLQYKAFNNDDSTTFSDNVSECPADDESNSVVPIAVGAALAGLVVIVLIAYLIGRRRSRRQGYESV